MLTPFVKGTQSNAEGICPSSNCFLCVIALLTTIHGSGFVVHNRVGNGYRRAAVTLPGWDNSENGLILDIVGFPPPTI